MTRATLKRHAALVDRLAGALGLDLEEEMLRGKLPGDTLAEAVLACTGCARADACDSALAARPEGWSAPPSYCRNGALFRELVATRG